jgi:tape measure domain-containing protein
MGANDLPLAGVEAIVEGLSPFQGAMRKMNSSLSALIPGTTLLQRAFTSVWDTVAGFGREVLNVAEVALGKILGDAIEWVVGKIGELISATIDAGSEFQTLELRLQRLNFNTLIESGEDATKAGAEALKMTKEQLDWLQKLAAQTPYDNADISKTYTLARSYGFVDQKAKVLTEDIVNFASGMGLGNTEIERIIINFGQMVQQGKVTQREMNDLARGAFVPVNDILKRMSENTGVAADEMDDFRKTAESVPAFMQAFSDVVKERFSGAAEQMAKTFKAASDNAQDVVKSIGGLNVVKPILDVIGARVAAFTASFTDNPERWDRMVNAAKRVGTALSGIVDGLFDLLPTSESLADSAVRAIEGIATWLEERGPGIKTFFKELGEIVGGVADRIKLALSGGQEKPAGQPTNSWDFLPGGSKAGKQEDAPFGEDFLGAVQKVADFINNTLIPAFVKVQVWFEVNKPLIDEFWKSVGDIISEVFQDITSQPGKEGGGGGILDTITRFMKFVIDNKDEIAKWVEILWSVFVVWQVLSTLWSILLGILIPIAAFFIGLSGILAVFGITISGPVLLAIGALILAVGGLFLAFQTNFMGIRDWATNLWTQLVTTFTNITTRIEQFGRDTSASLQKLVTAVQGIDWKKLGLWIMQGLANGITAGGSILISTMVSAAMKAYKAAKDSLGIKSPSKLFEGIGMWTMEGFAQGIEKAAGLAVGAMQSAVGQVAAPAISSMSAAQAGGNTITNNRTANLTVNTSAPVEPILQDFNMMESLMGA